MGYDLHITRAETWFENEGSEIAPREWLEYVESDPEMRLDGHAEAVVGDGEVLRYENEGLAVWTGYSGHDVGGNMAWFDFRRGNVVVKNPDDEIIGKMCSIAEKLNARVQGDEGEHYPLEAATPPREPPAAKPWWRRFLGG